jgi:hypothetical protein
VPAEYARFQEVLVASGSVQLDPERNHFFLWTISSPIPLASLFYGTAGCVARATGVFLPLDPVQEKYHRFREGYRAHFRYAADGTGLAVEASDATHKDFRVYRDEAALGKMVFLYNPAVRADPSKA